MKDASPRSFFIVDAVVHMKSSRNDIDRTWNHTKFMVSLNLSSSSLLLILVDY